MSFWIIAWRNMRQRALASSLTGLSMALGVALVICVIVIHSVAVRQFSQDALGYHFVVGSGKGSPLELVLTTVFHVGKPLYPIPYDYYREFTDGKFAPYVELAVPYCMGDSYPVGDRVFRCIGTTPDLFDKIEYSADDQGNPIKYEFAAGRNFKIENCYEAVLGSVVAAQSGLAVGDRFNPSHGIRGSEDPEDQHDAFVVVGILKPTGTANDRGVFLNMEGFYLGDGHALTRKDPPVAGEMAILGAVAARRLALEEGAPFASSADAAGVSGDEAAAGERRVVSVLPLSNTPLDNAVFFDNPELSPAEDDTAAGDAADAEDQATDAAEFGPRGALPPTVCYDHDGAEVTPLPEQQREVTSILVLCGQFGQLVIDQGVNKGRGSPAQAVAPTDVVDRLLQNIVGPVRVILLVLTVLIVIVAGISVLVSIYNSMSQRSHDIAVMRALGASRRDVMLIVLSESILLSVLGGLAGIVLGHALVGLAAPYVVATTGVRLAWWEFDPLEGFMIPALVALATLVGLLPAISAYRTDVAQSLGGAR